MKKLVILDLSKDYDLLIKDSKVFQLSFGKTEFKNCELIKKNFFSNKKFKIFIKDINILLFNFHKYLNKNNLDLNCLEIFNQRNDKTQIFNKIFFFNEILKYYKVNNFQEIEIITDDCTFLNSYRSIKIKNLKILDISKKQKKTFKTYFFSTLFFHIKSLLVILFAKIFIRKNLKYTKIEEGCLSIFPLFYKKKKHEFYKKKKIINFNFQLTDETHLGNSLFKNFKTLIKIRQMDYTLSVESFIKIPNFLLNFYQSLNRYKLITKANKYKFKVKDIDYSDQFRGLFFNSLLNLNKLNIYQNAFNEIAKNYNIKKFHLYLFEYNFGYYLINLVRKNFLKIVIIGYQHGLYSERIMWQNLSNKINLKKYFPDFIVCKYAFSLNAYTNNFKHISIKLLNSNKKIFRTKQKNNNGNKYNVYLGLHDNYYIMNELRNLDSKKIFKIFFHPKLKYKTLLNLKKNIKIGAQKFKKNHITLLSTTSTMPYEFCSKKNYYIILPNNIIPLSPSSLDKKILKI